FMVTYEVATTLLTITSAGSSCGSAGTFTISGTYAGTPPANIELSDNASFLGSVLNKVPTISGSNFSVSINNASDIGTGATQLNLVNGLNTVYIRGLYNSNQCTTAAISTAINRVAAPTVLNPPTNTIHCGAISTASPIQLTGTLSGTPPTVIQVSTDINFTNGLNTGVLDITPLVSGTNYTISITGNIGNLAGQLNLVAGNNTVYLRGIALGCTSSVVSVTITYQPVATVLTVSNTQNSCGGSSSFTISGTFSGPAPTSIDLSNNASFPSGGFITPTLTISGTNFTLTVSETAFGNLPGMTNGNITVYLRGIYNGTSCTTAIANTVVVRGASPGTLSVSPPGVTLCTTPITDANPLIINGGTYNNFGTAFPTAYQVDEDPGFLTSLIITATAPPAANRFTQTNLPGSGTFSLRIGNPGSQLVIDTTGNVSTTVYIRALVNGCPSASTAITVQKFNVNPLSQNLPGVQDITACAPSSITFSFVFASTPPLGTKVRLYNSANSTLPIFESAQYTGTPPNLLTVSIPNLTTTTTYYWEIVSSNAICNSFVAPTPRGQVKGIISSTTTQQLNVEDLVECINGNALPATVTFTATPGNPMPTTFEYSNSPNGPWSNINHQQSGNTVLLPISASTITNLAVGNPEGITRSVYFRAYNALGCTTSVQQAKVTLHRTNLAPGISYNSPVTRCSGGSITFTAISAINSEFNAVRIFTVFNGGTPILTQTTPPYWITVSNLTTSTTYYYEAYHTTTGCSSARANPPLVAIIGEVVPAPSIPNASFCGDNASLTLTATITTIAPAGSYKLFVYTSQNATMPVDSANFGSWAQGQRIAIFTLSNLFNTTTYFAEAVRIDINPVCKSNRVSFVVSRQLLSGLQQIPKLEICEAGGGAATPFTISFNANLGQNTKVRLFTQPNASVPIAESVGSNNYSFSVSHTFIFNPGDFSTTITYYVDAVNLANNCTTPIAERRAIEVIAYRRPTGSSLGTPLLLPESAVCGSGNLIILVPDNGTSLRSGVRLYNAPSGGNAVATANAPSNGNFILNTNQAITSSRIYYVAEFDKFSGCEQATRIPVAVNVENTPRPPTSSNVQVCDNGSGNTITFTVSNVVPGGAVRLYSRATPSAGEAVLDQKNLPPYELTALNVTQTTTFYVTTAIQTGSNPATFCESQRVPVVATIRQRPSVPALEAPAQRCGAGIIEFRVASNTVPAGNEVRLYSFSSVLPGPNGPLGTPLSTDNSAPFVLSSINPISVVTTFHIANYHPASGCESERVEVVGFVNPAPAAPEANNVSICGAGRAMITVNIGTTFNNSNLGGISLRLYTVPFGGIPAVTNNIVFSNEVLIETPVVTTNTTFYLATHDNNVYNNSGVGANCESPRKMVVVNVIQRPELARNIDVQRCGSGLVTITPSILGQGVTEVRLWN
ncbi:MAG: hypothetical protein RML72_11670, partial [Bacteroidia bacterium]|nr:hypothetical protein [Bacteroidia bacterium]MDW8159515.1 hypothetical protein [Bacteroidia bacterium]